MSRASPRRVQRAPERRTPRVSLPEAAGPLPPVDGPTLALFDLPEAGGPNRRRGRPPRLGDVSDTPDPNAGWREQPWPSPRRGHPDYPEDEASAAVVVPETCLSLLRANDRHDLPCPLVANAYRIEAGTGDGRWRVHAKVNAPQRLREALRRPGLVARPIQLGTLADPYLPAEREQRLTRALLDVLAEARHPVGLVSASPAVVRDLDLLADLASRDQALVLMRLSASVCPLGLTADPASALTEAVTPTSRRGRKPVLAPPGAAQREQLAASAWLQSLGKLSAAGVPVGVLLDLSADGLDPARLLAPAADPDRQAAWLALFAQLKASGARLWRCVLPVDRRADALALGVLAAQAGLSEALPTLNARPFTAPAAGVATGPRQVTLF